LPRQPHTTLSEEKLVFIYLFFPLTPNWKCSTFKHFFCGLFVCGTFETFKEKIMTLSPAIIVALCLGVTFVFVAACLAVAIKKNLI